MSLFATTPSSSPFQEARLPRQTSRRHVPKCLLRSRTSSMPACAPGPYSPASQEWSMAISSIRMIARRSTSSTSQIHPPNRTLELVSLSRCSIPTKLLIAIVLMKHTRTSQHPRWRRPRRTSIGLTGRLAWFSSTLILCSRTRSPQMSLRKLAAGFGIFGRTVTRVSLLARQRTMLFSKSMKLSCSTTHPPPEHDRLGAQRSGLGKAQGKKRSIVVGYTFVTGAVSCVFNAVLCTQKDEHY